MKHDRTRADFRRHICGLGLDEFEVTTMNGLGRFNTTLTTRAGLLQNVSYYIRLNSQGVQICIDGPEFADHDLIRLASSGRYRFDAMAAAGFEPAAIIQSASDRYEAWIRLGRPASSRVRGMVCDHLCEAYGLDNDGEGLIAGFRNRARKARFHRGHEYVSVLSAPGRPASAGPEMVLYAEARLAEGGSQATLCQEPGGIAEDRLDRGSCDLCAPMTAARA